MAWKLLFGSDIGLLSLFTILFVLLMAGYFMWMFAKKIAEEEQQSKMK